MTTVYQKLVEAVGEEKAREAMREMRSKVKNPYTPFKDKDFARKAQKKGVAARKANDKTKSP